MFDNRSKFKKYFTPLKIYFYIKTVLIKIKNRQANAPVERVHQLIFNMLITRGIDKKEVDYIDQWGETLGSIERAIMSSNHRTIQATAGQAIFNRYIIFNLASVVDWRVITVGKKRQVDIDNVQENAMRVTHDYTVGNILYMEMTGICRKIDYNNLEPYIITELFTNITVLVRRRQINGRINIRQLKPHFF